MNLNKYLKQLSCKRSVQSLLFSTAISSTLLLCGLVQWAIILLMVTALLAILIIHNIANDCKSLKNYLNSLDDNFDNHVEKWVSGPLKELQDPLVNMLRMKNRSNNINTSVIDEMSFSTQELSNNAQQVSQHSLQQSQATLSSSAAITEISQNIEEVYTRLEITSKEASGNKKVCEESHRALSTAQKQIQTISDFAEQGTEKLMTLDENMSVVTSMSKMIGDIAEQTNLLALNAAIEAARAGEHGRGFAVVANEVKALASRSQESIQAITAQTSEVNHNMDYVREHLGKFISIATDCQSSVSIAFDSLEKILVSSENVSDEILVIAAALDQQSVAAREISELIEEVASSAEKNTFMAKQTADVADHLYSIIENEGVTHASN